MPMLVPVALGRVFVASKQLPAISGALISEHLD